MTPVTSFRVSTNGYLNFGAVVSTNNTAVFFGAENQLIAFASSDLANGVDYSTQLTGTAPSRIFKLEATDFGVIGSARPVVKTSTK